MVVKDLPSISRIMVTLEMLDRASLHAHHAGVLFAAMAAANGLAVKESAFFPNGVMLDAPEQCRVVLQAHDLYTFGWTGITPKPDEAQRVTSALLRGLGQLGHAAKIKGQPFRGNFVIRESRDLIARQPLKPGDQVAAIPADHLNREISQLLTLDEVTLQFTSPLRIPKPREQRTPGHACWDSTDFSTGHFASRLVARLRQLSIHDPMPTERVFHSLEPVVNRLVWLDLEYGPQTDRKSLGGVSGRLVIRIRDAAIVPSLVLGQYLHAGQNTRFGFGAYRILELGPDPYACPRSCGLIELAMRSSALQRAADELDLPSGSCGKLARQVAAGKYQPQACTRVPIPKHDGGVRVLAIPSRPDRAVQRAVHVQLAPALDRFFEDSSLAYRRGLGRSRAAHTIRKAFNAGYRFALRADFTRFFDSIDHDMLEDRLSAYLQDSVAVGFLMACVKSGSPFENRGVPTGSPLSPLLANLFLDRFDEQIESEGGWLVRYADDFVILFKSSEEAAAAFARTRALAESLLLSLNEQKSSLIDLRESFEFLGFRFERRDSWMALPLHEPCMVDELGWKQAAPRDPGLSGRPILPGEVEAVSPSEDPYVIAGPGVQSVVARAGQLIFKRDAGTPPHAIPAGSIRELIVLGEPNLDARALKTLAEMGIPVTIAESGGRRVLSITPGVLQPDPSAAIAQVDACRDPAWRLAIAKRLIQAKVRNHRSLAQVCGVTGAPDSLEGLAARVMQCTSIEELLSVEGRAAAVWYKAFATLVPSWCEFPGRVSPDAEDPANILLNMAQSVLHRQVSLAIRAAGLIPGLGALHAVRPGHDALASDLQEPFRHLMDRLVIHALRSMKPSDFAPGARDSPYRIVIAPKPLQRFLGLLHESLTLACKTPDRADPASYLVYISASVRALRANMLDRSNPIIPFAHP